MALLRLLPAQRATQSGVVGDGNSVELSVSRRPSVRGWRVLQRVVHTGTTGARAPAAI